MMYCKLCKHYDPASEHGGQCQRYPPTVHYVTNANGMSDWVNERPFVGPHERCGEYTPENPDT